MSFKPVAPAQVPSIRRSRDRFICTQGSTMVRVRPLKPMAGRPRWCRPVAKSEGRNPKAERRPKPETRRPSSRRDCGSHGPACAERAPFREVGGLLTRKLPGLPAGHFGFRISAFVRPSPFGFRISANSHFPIAKSSYLALVIMHALPTPLSKPPARSG